MNKYFAHNDSKGEYITCNGGLKSVWGYASRFCDNADDVALLTIEPFSSDLDDVPWNDTEGAPLTVLAHYADGSISEIGLCNFLECPYRTKDDDAAVQAKYVDMARKYIILFAAMAVAAFSCLLNAGSNIFLHNWGWLAVNVINLGAAVYFGRLAYIKVKNCIVAAMNFADASARAHMIISHLNTLIDSLENGKDKL